MAVAEASRSLEHGHAWQAMLIANPAAGHGRCRAAVEALGRRDVVWTSEPGDAARIAADAYAGGTRRFLLAGGDGTVFEVVNGLFPEALADPVELGVLPLGTGNSLIRDFGIRDLPTALAAAESPVSRPCDLLRVTHAQGVFHYLNLLSLGFSAEVARLTNRRFKALGDAGYLAAVLALLLRPRHAEVRFHADGEAMGGPCTLVSFSNSQYTGGAMHIAPGADPADGRLDIVFVAPLGRLAMLRHLPRIYAGSHGRLREVRFARARQVAFDRPARAITVVDGEVLELELRSIEVLEHAVRILVPENPLRQVQPRRSHPGPPGPRQGVPERPGPGAAAKG